MKRWLWYVVLGVGFVIAAQSSVYALDPPHSLNSAVDCGECHGEGLFQTDPSTMTPDELRQAYNDMCKRCHVSNDGSYNATDSPRVEPHNSNTVNGEFTFQTSCTDCHHPHLQTQQMYWGRRTVGSPGQLFKGLVTTIKYFNAAHDQEVSKEQAALTEVTYDLAFLVVKAGSVWDTTDGKYPPTGEQLIDFPDGVPGEPYDGECIGLNDPHSCCTGWQEGTCIETGLHNLEHKMYKLHEKPGRGAMFLPFYRSHYNSRIIQSIDTDANTITFKGTVPSNYEGYMTNPAYGFAIYLGLAVNIQVRHDNADANRPVYLFDRTGEYGFGHQDYCEPEYTDVTDCTDSTPNGLCQACHTLTDFYKNDGTGLSHYNGSDCMECHAHHLGFKSASTVDHTGTTIALVRSPVECTACHDPGGNTAYVFDIHQENCDACHVNGQDLRLDYGSPDVVDLSTDGADCAYCHENGTTVTYLTDFDNLTTGHQVADHSGMTGNTGATTVTTSCYTATYCHYAPTKVDIAEVIHSDCTDCHVNTGNDGRLIDGPNNYGDATVHVIYSTISTCDVCHLADGYFDSHTHPVHDSVHRDGTDQSNDSDCEACHQTNNNNDLDTWTDIFVEHQNSCTLCHDATRDVNPGSPTGITIQDRIAFGSGNKVSPTGCLHCHADRSATHMPDHKLTGMVTGSTTNCVPCHDPSDIDNENHYLLTVHTACGVCHVTGTGGGELWNYGPSGLNTGGTIDEYVNYEGIDGNTDPTYEGGSCTDCHVNYSNDFGAEHQVVSHNLIGSNGNCTGCHTGDIITVVHNTAGCTDCHVNSTIDGSLVSGTNGSAAAPEHTMGATSYCTTCHGASGSFNYDTDFDGAHNNVDHETTGGAAPAVTISSACTNTCHAQTTAADIIAITHKDNCLDCHNNTGSDGLMHAGDVVGSIADAISYGTAAGHGFDSTSSCVDCHENGTTFTYLSDYGGANGHRVVDHDGLTGTTNSEPIYDCNNCHAAATKIQIEATTHTACSNCHNSSGDLVGAVTNGTTLNHVMGQTSNCVECHGVSGGDYDTNFENHIYANDTTDHKLGGSGNTVFQLAGTDEISGTKCDACHGSTLTDWANVYDLHNVGAGACATCHNSTRDYDTDDGGSVQTVIHDNNPSTNPCISCHYSYRLDHSDHVATGWVYGNAECTGCHDQAGAADQDQYIVVLHNNSCDMCHTDSGNSDYTLKVGTSAEGHNTGTTNTCNTCHNGANGFPDYAADFNSHTSPDHTWVGSNAECSGCHAGDVVNLDVTFDVHNDNCQNCHINTGSDGSLHAGDIVGSIGDGASYGTAAYPDHQIGTTSSCLDCHENGTTLTYLSDYGGVNGHQVVDHDGLTGTTSGTPIYDCNNCHAAATKIQIEATTHTACSNCHNSSGDLVGAVTNGTTLNHVMGQTSNCVECHGVSGGDYDTNFENHIYANDTTDHKLGGSGNTVFQLAGTDEISGTKCDACHGSTLTDWANVYDLHNVGAGACATCHNSTRDYDTDDGGSVQTVIHDNNPSTNPCISCHYSYRLDHSDHVATGWVYGNAECTGCHDQAGAADQDQYIVVLHNNSCDMCHTDSGNSDYTLKVGTSAEGHNTGTTNTCNTCHNGANGFPDYAADFAAHTNVDHQTTGAANAVESTATCTGNCHTGNMIDVVHNPDCTDCHVNTTTDGRLVDSAGAGDGTAGDHTIDSTSSCADCHEYGYVEYTYLTDYDNLTSGHKVQDHDGLTGTTSGTPIYDCNNCHAAATKVEIAGTTHDADCLSCHAADGDLVGNVTNGDTSGHTIGTTSNCADCHSSRASDFANHNHADASNHDSDGSGTSIAQNGSDLCELAPCSNCHAGSNFADVYTTHNSDTNGPGPCATCHNSTRSNATQLGSIDDTLHGDNSIQEIIAKTNYTYDETNKANCLLCHLNKDTTHGGHRDTDFGWDGNCKDCHGDGSETEAVVSNIHAGPCTICHSSALGSASNEDIGSTTYGVDGDAKLADGDAGSWNATCTTCHPQNGNSGGAEPFNTWVQAHHDDSPSNYSANGECDSCHTDPRLSYPTAVSPVNIAYKQLACVNCHVVDDLSGGIKAVRNELKDATDGANSTRDGNTQTDIAGHAWPNTPLATGIKNYGSCFYCHGQTGVAAGRATNVTVPLHAMPTPTDKDTRADVGAPFVRDGNLIGGGAWQTDCWDDPKDGTVYGDWSITKLEGDCGYDFRGGEGVVSSKWTNSYFPLGKTTINIAWGAYALPKKAANNTEHKENVATLVGHTKFNIIAGLKWGYVADIPHNGNSWHVIPIFDNDPINDLGVDTLNEVAPFSVNWTGTTGPIDTRTITVNVESNDGGATLYLVYGGHIITSGPTPLNVTVDFDVEAENALSTTDANSKGGLYASPDPGIIWVVSDKGGSITLVNPALQGQGHD